MTRIKQIIIAFLPLLLATGLFGAHRTSAFQTSEPQSDARAKPVATPTPTPTPSHPLIPLRREFGNSFPIPSGEKLEYDVKFSRFGLSFSVGVVTFENLGLIALQSNSGALHGSSTRASGAAPLIEGLNLEFVPGFDEKLLHLRATAVSKGMLTTLLGLEVRDRFETLVDMRDFSARLSFKEAKEGKRHFLQSAIFDRADQQIKYLTTDLNRPDLPPRAKALPWRDGASSLLSAFYFVRLQKMKEGQMLRFPVSTDEENYEFDILVVKREKIKTDCGKIKTVKLEPKLFGSGGLVSREGRMFIWVSDNNRRTVLRLVAKTTSGTVTAKLLNFRDKCNILEEDGEEEAKNGKTQK